MGDGDRNRNRDVRPALPEPPVKTMRLPVLGAAIVVEQWSDTVLEAKEKRQ